MMTDREFQIWREVLLSQRDNCAATERARDAVLALRELERVIAIDNASRAVPGPATEQANG